MLKEKCSWCYPRPQTIVLHNGPKCWIRATKERTTYLAILKRHNEDPSPEDITHMRNMLIKLKSDWWKDGKMEIVELAGPLGSKRVGGHYILKFQPKREVRKNE